MWNAIAESYPSCLSELEKITLLHWVCFLLLKKGVSHVLALSDKLLVLIVVTN